MESIDRLVRRYRTKGVFVDANLLLLYVVGLYDRTLIPQFKRTARYTVEDYDLLHLLLGGFKRRVTTPNVLTEVSNLLGTRSKSVLELFGEVICQEKESYVPSARISREESYLRHGLTDACILDQVGRGLLLLTDDLDLCVTAQGRGLDAINFNHIRSWFWER